MIMIKGKIKNKTKKESGDFSPIIPVSDPELRGPCSGEVTGYSIIRTGALA